MEKTQIKMGKIRSTIFYLIIYLIIFSHFDLGAQGNACLGYQDYKVVVLGSSTAAGAGPSHPDSAWVNRYRAYLQSINPNNQVMNLAVGGYNTYKIMPTGYIPPPGRPTVDTTKNITAAIALNADAIIVNMPSNDVAIGISVNEQLFNLDTIAQLANEANIPIWICTTQPKNFSIDSLRQVQEDLKDSIIMMFQPFSIDFWTTFATWDNYIDPLYDADGTHLNDAGHRILFQRVVNAGILNYIFVPPAYTDNTVESIKPLLTSSCGDSLTDIQIIVSNIGAQGNSDTYVIFSITNLNTFITLTDSIIFTGGIASCSIDTVYFTENTYEQGFYQALCYVINQSDTINGNDTLYNNFYSQGHPAINIFNDTLCSPGSATLQAITGMGDTVFWYNDPNDTIRVGYGDTFITPPISSTTSWYAEAVRGNFFYSDSMFTTNTSNINWNGTMFDIIAHEDIVIDSFDVKINSVSNQGIAIYYKAGSYQGYEQKPSSWALLGTDTVSVLGSGTLTRVPIGDLSISTGDTIGIYIHMLNSNSTLSYQSMSVSKIRSNQQLTMISGSGVSYNFSGQYYPREWNGKVYYHYGYKPNGDCSTGRMEVTALVNYNSSVDLGPDTIIDPGTTIALDADTGYVSYLWSDGSTDHTIFVDTTGVYWVEVITTSGCISRDTISVWSGYNIIGSLRYGDTTNASPPMSGVTIILRDQGYNTVSSAKTDTSGNFEFSGLWAGTYYIDQQISLPWGGSNTLDALMTLQHFVGLHTLTGLNLVAADVNGDNVANASDALNIQQRFVGLITSFIASDWLVEDKQIIVGGNKHTTFVYKSLCTGDVDGSHIP